MADIRKLDWNLLPALDALLTERSVTRAARRLGVTQPSLSATLARLRRLYDDQLLVRIGNTHELTPLGEHLAPLVRSAVQVATRTLGSATTFEPSTSTREFTLAASDYVQLSLAPSLQRRIREHAPSVRVRFASPFGQPYRDNRDVLVQSDGWIAPSEMVKGAKHSGSLEDEWVCVVDRNHPTIGATIRPEALAGIDWVAPTVRGDFLRLQEEPVTALGIDFEAVSTTDTFAAIPLLVSGTSRVGIMQRSLANLMAPVAGIRVVPCPWPVQPLRLTFWWDQSHEADPGHQWLRSLTSEWMVDLSMHPVSNQCR